MLRVLLKTLLYTLAGVLLLALLIVAALLTSPVQTLIAHKALAMVNKNLQGQILLGRLHVRWNGHIVLEDVRLLDPDSVLVARVGKLYADVNLRELRQQFAHVTQMTLSDMTFALSMDSSGSNVQKALAPRKAAAAATSEPGQATSWVVQLDKLDVQGGPSTAVLDTLILFDAAEWSLALRARYGHDSLNYGLHLTALPSVEIETAGLLILAPEFAPVRGSLALTADSAYVARFAQAAAAAGDVRLNSEYALCGDSLVVSAKLNASELGRVVFDGAAPFPPEQLAGRGTVVFDSLTPGALWQDSTRMLLNGSLVFSKQADASIANGWNASLRLASSYYGRYALKQGELKAETRDSTARADGQLDTGHGSVRFEAQVKGFVPERAQVRAVMDLDRMDLHALVPQVPDTLGPITGHIIVNAARLDPKALDVKSSLVLRPVTLGMYRLDTLVASARIKDRHFAIDTMYVTSERISLSVGGDGELDGPFTFFVEGSLPDLGMLRRYIPTTALADSDTLAGSATLDVRGEGSLAGGKVNSISVAGGVWLDSVLYGPYKMEYAALDLTRFDPDSVIFNTTLRVRGVEGFGQRLDSLEGNASGKPDDIRARLRLWAKADTIAFLTDARVMRSAQGFTIDLDTLGGRAYGIEFTQTDPARITLSGNKAEVDALTITSNVGVLRAFGTVERGGQQDVAVELSGVRTGEVARLLAMPLPESTVNLRLQITGPDSAIAGDISLIADTVSMDGMSIADQIMLHGSIDGKRGQLDGLVIWLGDTTVIFDGQVPATLSLKNGVSLAKDQPIAGHLQVLEQPLEKLNHYMPVGTQLAGYISSDMRFSGTPATPEWKGQFSVRQGEYRDSRAGVRYKDINITGGLDGDTLRVPSFDMKSNGTLKGSGWVVMGFPLPEELHLDLRFDKFQAVNSSTMRAKVTGDVAINGRLNALVATGRIRVDESLYRITGAAMKNIEPIDVKLEIARLGGDTTKPLFSIEQMYRSMTNEISLEIPGNSWVKGSGLNLELAGQLWLYKDRSEEPTLNGNISVRRGTVGMLGREFRVTSGSVTFDGPISNPTLDVTAFDPNIYAQRQDSITVRVFGTLKDTRVELSGRSSSGESMTSLDAASSLIRGAKGGTGTANPISAAALEQAATSTATGQLTGMLGQMAGFDVFRFRSDESGWQGLTSGSLEVGTYVTDRLFVRVVQPVQATFGKEDVSVEYRLFRWLNVRAQQTQQSSSAFDLLMQYDWR